jgi:hypothetical protein
MSDSFVCKHVFAAGEEVKHSNARSRKHSTIVYCQEHECEFEKTKAPCVGKVQREPNHDGQLLCRLHNKSSTDKKTLDEKNANVDPAQDEQPVQLPQVERAEDEVDGNAANKKKKPKKRKQLSAPVVEPASDDACALSVNDLLLEHLQNEAPSPYYETAKSRKHGENAYGDKKYTYKYYLFAQNSRLAKAPPTADAFAAGLKVLVEHEFFYDQFIPVEGPLANAVCEEDATAQPQPLPCPFFPALFDLQKGLMVQLSISHNIEIKNSSGKYFYMRATALVCPPAPFIMRLHSAITRQPQAIIPTAYIQLPSSQERRAMGSGSVRELFDAFRSTPSPVPPPPPMDVQAHLPLPSRSRSRSPDLYRSPEIAQTSAVVGTQHVYVDAHPLGVRLSGDFWETSSLPEMSLFLGPQDY